jgi:hypothetical protein
MKTLTKQDLQQWKFDVLNAVRADNRLNDVAYAVSLAILFYEPKDEVELVSEAKLPRWQVERALTSLRNTGWLKVGMPFEFHQETIDRVKDTPIRQWHALWFPDEG